MSGAPLSVEERGMQRVVAAAISGMDGLDPTMFAHGDMEVDRMPEEANSWREFLKTTGLFPYYINADGSVVHTMDEEHDGKVKQGAIAVIPVNGVLVREAWTAEEVFWGLASSDRLAKFIRKVSADTRVVKAMALANTPGGQVSGIEKLGKAWDQLTASKGTLLHVDDLCCSGGVWFGCGSGSIQMAGETAEIGSIGVMLSFWDLIPLFEAWGARYHEYYAKESGHKNEGWRDVREKKDPGVIKADLSRTAGLFQQRVRDARGAKLNSQDEAVLSGRVYAGSDAITAGLADGIADFDECLAMLRATPTAAAPPSAAPEKNLAPNNDGTTDSNANSNTTNTPHMSIVARLVALAAGLFSSKEEVTAENIEAANKELAAKEITGVVFADAAKVKAAEEAAERIAAAENAKAGAETATAEANKAKTAAEAERDAAKTAQAAAEKTVGETNAALDAVIAELKLEKKEGESALATVTAALKSATATVSTQQAEIATLKGQAAPDGKAAGAVNTQGDTKTGDEDLTAQLDAAAHEFLKK